MLADGIGDGDEDQVVGAAGADGAGGGRIEPPLPVVEQPQALGVRVAGLVGEIVGAPANA